MARDFLGSTSQDEAEQRQPRDFLVENKEPDESYLTSLLLAPSRALTDAAKGGLEAFNAIPSYAKAATTEVPGLLNTARENPKHLGSQFVAGLGELGEKTFNAPHDVINYLSQRLHLVPEDINKSVQMGRMPGDTTALMNEAYGRPIYPGEKLLRGTARNALNIATLGRWASNVNPMKLTTGGITKTVLNEEKRLVESHTNRYNSLWKKADRKGFNNVSYDPNSLIPDARFIAKFYPEKSTFSFKKFLGNPTLENAQKAQSDLGQLRRSLEEKSRTTPLLESEKMLHEKLYNSEKHIENNMFKDANGNVNKLLKNEYDKLTKSYRENVVPYKYNADIQAYKNKEITKKQLVNRLKEGEFAAKKGHKHPAIAIRNALLPLFGTAGLLGGATYLYDKTFGNK